MGILKQFPANEAANAFVALLFAASAPVAIILSAGSRGGLDEVDLASWIFAAFAVNGAITIGMSVAYRQPLAFFLDDTWDRFGRRWPADIHHI